MKTKLLICGTQFTLKKKNEEISKLLKELRNIQRIINSTFNDNSLFRLTQRIKLKLLFDSKRVVNAKLMSYRNF